MAKFVISPHFRLHEWVAEEKGYFRDAGLEYEFREVFKTHATPDRVGAHTSFAQGRDTNVSCACHWTVNVAASNGHGKLWGDIYSVAPAGVFVPEGSPIRTPEELAGVPISVGYQSGSHYATLQALEPYLPREKINLSFGDGMLFKRLDNLLEGRSQASTLFSGPYYLAEQMGYRKIIDTTFMIASMVTGTPEPADLKRFYNALKRAQRDIDLRPDRYTHYYKNEFPVRYHAQMDTRRWGPGERLVFEPYTKEVYDETFRWISDRGIFADSGMGSGDYEKVVIRLSP
jgi:hypothetical protein